MHGGSHADNGGEHSRRATAFVLFVQVCLLDEEKKDKSERNYFYEEISEHPLWIKLERRLFNTLLCMLKSLINFII